MLQQQESDSEDETSHWTWLKNEDSDSDDGQPVLGETTLATTSTGTESVVEDVDEALAVVDDSDDAAPDDAGTGSSHELLSAPAGLVINS